MPLVSVVMNTYRTASRYLEDALESYLTQQGVEVQLVVSTVEGDPAVATARARGCQVVLSDRPGIYTQLNNALPAVEGEWFAYAAADDVAEPWKLADEVATCAAASVDVCYSSFYITDHLLRVRSMFRAPAPEYSWERHLQSNYVSDCALMSRSLLAACGPFDVSVGDHAYWDFWLRAHRVHGARFAYNPKPEWYYRQHTEAVHAKWTDAQRAQREKDAVRMLSTYRG